MSGADKESFPTSQAQELVAFPHLGAGWRGSPTVRRRVERQCTSTYIRWLRKHEGKLILSERKIQSVTALDLIKCFNQIK